VSQNGRFKVSRGKVWKAQLPVDRPTNRRICTLLWALTKSGKRWLGGTVGAIALLIGCGAILVSSAPRALIPRFLRGYESKERVTIYNAGVHRIVRAGRETYVPQVLVTENQSFQISGPFEDLLAIAQEELTADRGWDFSAAPRDGVAKFHQRTTNTTIDLRRNLRAVNVTVAQTRFATLADRIRQWWSGIRS